MIGIISLILQILCGLGILLLLLFYWFCKHISGGHEYWTKRGVETLEYEKDFWFWEKITIKYPFHIAIRKQYEFAKRVGIGRFAGLMEHRMPALYLKDPELIKQIWVKDFDHFINRRVFKSLRDPLFHKMLVTSLEDTWKPLRSIISPSFTIGKIKRMESIFQNTGDKLCNFLEQEISKAGSSSNSIELEFRNVWGRYTMDMISSVAFGLESGAFKDYNSEFCDFARRFVNPFAGRFGMIKSICGLLFPNLIKKLGVQLTDEEASGWFSNVIRQTLKYRIENQETRNDFLQLLIEAKTKAETDESTENFKFTEDHILANSLIFFLAGYDNLESLLMSAVYELTINPEIQERLHKELGAARNNFTIDNILEFPYLNKIVHETLRKYPPIIRVDRTSTQPYKIPGTEVILDKGTVVVAPIYAIHHDPDYYPNPDVFDPERFSPEAVASRKPCTFIPFGAGPRSCVAIPFVFAEAKTALANLILKFKLEPCSKTQIPMEYQMQAGFKPKHGIWVKVIRR